MITFGNEIKPKSHPKPNSQQNSNTVTRPNNHQTSDQNTKHNSNSVTKKPTDLEKLQYKYRKLDKENKKLKSNLEEMMSLSKNLQNSLEKTEGLYATIHNSLKEGKNEELNKENCSLMEGKITFSKNIEEKNLTNNLIIDNFCFDLISYQIPSNVILILF